MDSRTLEAFRYRDANAVRAMYREYGNLVYTVAYHALGRHELAEEAVQHTFVNAWQAADRLDLDRDPAPWLATIARRAAIDIYRRESRRPTIALAEGGARQRAVTTIAGETLDAVWHVRQAIDALPSDEATIVRLQHLDGLTHREISEKLGLALGTVKSRSHRAHRSLARLWGICGTHAMTDHLTPPEHASLLRDAAPGPLGPAAYADAALLADLLAAPATWAEIDPGLEDTVVQALAAAEPVRPSVVTRLPARSRRRPVRRWVVGSAAAAVVAAIATAGAFTLTGTEEHPDFRAELTATALAPTAGAALAGGDVAATHAEVEMYHSNAGFRVTLDAHGLPTLPPDEYYQAWLQSWDGTQVPIGTFSSSEGHVTLWSGVSAKEFPIVSVTVEPTDKQLAPSGHRVLVGELHPE